MPFSSRDLHCEDDSVSSEWTHSPPRRSGGRYVGWLLSRRDDVVPEEPQNDLGVGLSTSDDHPHVGVLLYQNFAVGTRPCLQRSG